MAAIKRFFEKKKLDIKFKKAGSGHKLTDDTRQAPVSAAGASSGRARAGPSSESRMAAEAALARSSQPKPGEIGTSMASIKAQVKKEMEAEKKAVDKAKRDAATYSEPQEVHIDAAPVLAVGGVLFRCPMAGDAVLPKEEMEGYIEEFLTSQLAEEPEMAAALMIHTLNKDKEKVKACIEILCKYLDNIKNNPGEEKYRKIRIQNKVFQDKVEPIKGTCEFLQAAGFEMKMFTRPTGEEEMHYIMIDERATDAEKLQNSKDLLSAAEPIKPELDRNVQVFYPSANAHRIQVPDDFYSVSAEELKREQQRKQEAVEKLGMLRTKEMREREHLRELRRYRYTLIRVRFPDGVILQGTFRALEKLSSLISFVRECLENDWIPFYLNTQTGHKLTDEDLSLAELGLAPAAIVNFAFDADIQKEIAAQHGSIEDTLYLKEHLMASIQSI